MGKVIAFISGKGGTGKTSVVSNLGISLARAGFSVCMVDTDIAMANLSLVLGMQSSPITLHDVLIGEATIHDTIYDGPEGIKFIPSGLSLDSYKRVDSEKLASVIDTIKNEYDFILLDAPAGIGKDVMASIAAADSSLLVTMPTSPAIAGLLKAKIVAQRLGNKPIGIIVNFYYGEKGEIQDTDISKMLELPVYGVIPYDDEVRKTFLHENVSPVVVRVPNSPASLAFYKTVKKLTGVEIKVEKKKSGFDFLKKGSPSAVEQSAEPEKPREKKIGFLDIILGFFKKK